MRISPCECCGHGLHAASQSIIAVIVLCRHGHITDRMKTLWLARLTVDGRTDITDGVDNCDAQGRCATYARARDPGGALALLAP